MDNQGKQELENLETGKTQENPMVKKRWFGRGIYGSKDIPIRFLDGFIGVLLAAIVVMIIFFAIRGGFYITFDSDGGSAVEKQKVRHGHLIEEPENPVKPGYVFNGWWYEKQETMWDFDTFTVSESMELIAQWVPATVMVKFDLDGGTLNGEADAEPIEVTFGESYGKLPVPQKEGYTFKGWIYSGNEITEDSQVMTNGEHVLTAEWE